MNTFIQKIVFAFFLLLVINSCNRNTNTSDKSADVNTSNVEQNENTKDEKPKEKEISIAGVYSGIDNIGMETTIEIKSNGVMIAHPSVGDGTPCYGRWEGTANNLSLYIPNELEGEQLLGHAKITDQGLQIIGGSLYERQ